MEWNSELDIGVEEMNDQHKKLLDLMNILYSDFNLKVPFEKAKITLDELKNYTIQHFKEEEEYMESVNFDGLVNHKLIHQQLLNKFEELYLEMLDSKEFNQKFFEFLKFWLTSHIKGIDTKYASFAKAS